MEAHLHGDVRPVNAGAATLGPHAQRLAEAARAGGAHYLLKAVTEILFYHLQRQPLEKVLPSLIEKSLERGWQAAIQAVSEERLQALDDGLWTYTDESFLPHGTDRDTDAATQPVLLTLREANSNGASIRFLVEGADLPEDAGAYARICVLFDGTDQDALLRARDQWKGAKEAGHAVAYWQQDESGRWTKKA